MSLMYRVMRVTQGYGTECMVDGFPYRALADLEAIRRRVQLDEVVFVQEYEEARTAELYALAGKPKK